jgi:hypothetical protein
MRNKQASVLAFTLIMLGVLLATGLSLMGATVLDQQAASGTNDSVQALSAAESGTQILISKISNGSDIASLGVCAADGKVSGTSPGGNGSYEAEFFKEDGSRITNCLDSVSDIASIKSTGTYANTNRAVEVAVAATAEKPCGSVAVLLSAGIVQHGTGCVIANTSLTGIESFITSGTPLTNALNWIESHCIAVSTITTSGNAEFIIHQCYSSL